MRRRQDGGGEGRGGGRGGGHELKGMPSEKASLIRKGHELKEMPSEKDSLIRKGHVLRGMPSEKASRIMSVKLILVIDVIYHIIKRASTHERLLLVHKNSKNNKPEKKSATQAFTHVCIRKQIQNRTHSIVYTQNTSMIFNT